MQLLLFDYAHLVCHRCSWYEFAQEILKFAGIKGAKVAPITSEELARSAPRPRFSVLDNCCLRLSLGNGMREWKEALKDFLENDFPSQSGMSESE